MQILFSRNFRKRFDRLHLYLQNKFKIQMKLLVNNENNEILNIHSLKGKYLGLQSMNVTGDIRAIFEYKNDTTLIFHDIGSHSELYG